MKQIILASASPRRRELLAQIGLDFTVLPASGEEKITKQIPSEVVEELSGQSRFRMGLSSELIRWCVRTVRLWENQRMKQMRCGC